MICVTLWSSSGLATAWARGRAALESIRPHAVQLHGSPTLLTAQAPAIAERVRAALPGTRIWLGVGADAGHTDVAAGKLSPAELRERRLRVGQTAVDAGADTVVLNAEKWWKSAFRPAQGGFDAAAASLWVRELRAAHPTLAIEHSSFASPKGHGTFPWGGFLGPGLCTRSWYQLYLEGKANPPAWLLDLLRDGLAATPTIAPACVAAPYLQAHSARAADTSWLADQFADACFWAAGDRMDGEGMRVARALVEIERRGFVGVGRVAAFQRSAGLVADSKIGARTFAALGL